MEYPHENKKKLAASIAKIKNKEHLLKIYEIISEDTINFTDNNNGMFALFNKLKTETYQKLESYINEIKNTDQTSSDKKEYVPYHQPDFPSQEGISAKLKYSNKEINLIKRHRYDKSVKDNTASTYVDFNDQPKSK